ncbi:Partner of bursicon [Holothuria leucospilota]|uniref:Partner of bursicon n=1 Tax=Holothuria leucospilota TaxID=206669 RepID=A0A9Q0YM93_HOLLE|nr:Partner of bursicon [Holothuria leucospilota]
MSFLLILLLCAANGVLVRSRNERERCSLSEKHMHVNLQKFDSDRGQMVSCRGQITVSYCEGSCRSRTIPSVETFSGFKKMCRCCFESSTQTVRVPVPHCRIVGGRHLQHAIYFDIKQPTACSCARCQS